MPRRTSTGSDNRRTTIWLSDADRAAILAIRKRFGPDSDSAAIRLALRVLAEAQKLEVVMPPGWVLPGAEREEER